MPPSEHRILCCEVSQSHLGQCIVLLKSILTHETSVVLYLLVIDLESGQKARLGHDIVQFVNQAGLLEVTVLTLEDAYGELCDTLRFIYDPFELCMVSRGGIHKWILENTAHERWIHLDTDMYCLGSLDQVFDRLGHCDILLSAHRDSPAPLSQEDQNYLMYGPFNGGLLGIRRSEASRRFVAWFHERLTEHGRVDIFHPLRFQPNQRFGYFGDQSWLTLVPMYFDNVSILKDRGLNFGPWSLQPEEEIERDSSGVVRAGSTHIRLIHLSGWRSQQPNLLAYYKPRDMSGNAFWRDFIARYIDELERASVQFFRPYRYASFNDGKDISVSHRRSFLKLLGSHKKLGQSPFQSRKLLEAVAANFDTYDYFPPGLDVVAPDAAFPAMVEGNRWIPNTPYLRREIPHKWYVDIRTPGIGFVSRDEALILFNTAKLFKDKAALEIGCWKGWSACHLALGGVQLDIIDPILNVEEHRRDIQASLDKAGVMSNCRFIGGSSPQAVRNIAAAEGKKWSLIFIDGSHEGDYPIHDASVAAEVAEADAIILLHDLAFPDVARGLALLRSQGWQTMIYLTMQLMAVAWRGQVSPVRHIPDPNVIWNVPHWIANHPVSQ